jgi:chromosome segregation ATPase
MKIENTYAVYVKQRTRSGDTMKAVEFIRSRIRSLAGNKDICAEQDMVLYRQLRQAEDKIHAASDALSSILESHAEAVAENASLTQRRSALEQQAADNRDLPADMMRELNSVIDRQKHSARQLEDLQGSITSLKEDIKRLETDYQCAQINVRTYFYLHPCSDGLPEAQAAAGQPT